MYFDRFDICSAYYHFAELLVTTKQGHAGKAIIRSLEIELQLERMQYKAGISDSKLATASDNAKAIYMNLVKQYFNQ